jgi:hypothetical protein
MAMSQPKTPSYSQIQRQKKSATSFQMDGPGNFGYPNNQPQGQFDGNYSTNPYEFMYSGQPAPQVSQRPQSPYGGGNPYAFMNPYAMGQGQAYGAASGVAGGINSAFDNMGAGNYGVVPDYQQPYQSLHSQGIPMAGQGANFLWQGFLGAPNDVANGINNAFDQQQFYMDRAADRDLKMGIVNSILGGLGGLTGGGGNRMSGFVDMNSGQAASLPGQTTNAITAQALSPQAIAQAAQQARGPVSAPAVAAKGATPQQASEVNQIAQASAKNRGADNANTIERNLTADNANLKRSIELAKSKQGLGNADFLTGLNQDNVQLDVAMKAPIIRALLSGLMSNLA